MTQIGTSNTYYLNTSTIFISGGNYTYTVWSDDLTGHESSSSTTNFLMPPNYEIDLFGDGNINILDLNLLALQFGTGVTPGSNRQDVTNDGIIDILDLNLVAYWFGTNWWT
jgi:hypothetical protein